MLPRIILIALLLFTAAKADDQLVNGNGATTKVVLQDKADDLRVNGNKNVLTVTGHGDTLHVMGSGNQIEVDATLDSINVLGSGNKITFVLREGRPKPDYTNLGKDNQLDYR